MGDGTSTATQRFRRTVVLCGAFLLVWAAPVQARMLNSGDTAPPFELATANGNVHTLAEFLQDRAVLLMFGSVGCGPCEANEPALREARDLYGEQLAVVLVMLSPVTAVKAKLGKAQPPLDAWVLIDPTADDPFPTARAYGVMGTPTSYLIDRDGSILWRRVGLLDREYLRFGIPTLLATRMPSPVEVSPSGDAVQPGSTAPR